MAGTSFHFPSEPKIENKIRTFSLSSKVRRCYKKDSVLCDSFFSVRVILFKLMPIGCCEKPFCETNSRDLHEYLEGGKLRARTVKIPKGSHFDKRLSFITDRLTANMSIKLW